MSARRTLLLVVVSLGAALFTSIVLRPAIEAAGDYILHLPVIVHTSPIQLEAFALGEPQITELAFSPDGRLFTAVRDGRIFEISPDGQQSPTAYLDIRNNVETAYYEQGLLGLAFHPDFATNGFLYVYYTARGSEAAVLSRYTADPAAGTAGHTTELRLLTIPHDDEFHYGGALRFGPDGYLYVASGDGTHSAVASTQATPNAQNGANLLGKILRLDVDGQGPDGDPPYAIPADNPFVSDDNVRDEIWHLGLRNPWRFSFDRATGDLYIADVGWREREEINVVSAGVGGFNFGWPCFEGDLALAVNDLCRPSELFTFPAYTYPHSEGRCAITGGFVYRGQALPHLTGGYLFTDYCGGGLWLMRGGGSRVEPIPIPNADLYQWIAFTEDKQGEPYLANFFGPTTVYRLGP